MDYDQIDVLDKGTVWQGGALDTEIDSPPFAGPLLVVCMDHGEDNNQFINHATVEAVLTVWIDDVPTGGLKDGVLTGLADAIVAWLNDGGNVYLHCHQGVSRASYIDVAVHCRALAIGADDALARIKAKRPIADPNPGFLAQAPAAMAEPARPAHGRQIFVIGVVVAAWPPRGSALAASMVARTL